MDMKKLCSDADTVLELLYNTYYEHVYTDDTDEIKQAFDDLYNALSDKTLKERTQSSILSVTSAACTNNPASPQPSNLPTASPTN